MSDDPTATTTGELACVAAEASILGACLSAPTATGRLLDRIGPECFTRPEYRAVYTAITAIAERGRLPDPVVVLEHLQRNEVRLPGHHNAGSLLADLLAATPLAAVAQTHRGLVQEYARRRELDALGVRLQQLAATAEADTIGEVLEKIAAAVSGSKNTLDGRLLRDVTGAGMAA